MPIPPIPPPSTSALSRRLRRFSRSWLLTGFIGLSALPGLHAQDPHAKGLRPLTEADRAWIEANTETPGKVQLNKLAVERINAERRQKGVAPLSTAGVAFGKEITPKAPRGKQTRAEAAPAAAVDPANLPVAADNSTLKSFPPVTSQGSLSACLSYATTYYAATHMTGMLRGTDNKGPNAIIFSPKWTYTMTNGGADDGGTVPGVYAFLQYNGVATREDVPFDNRKLPENYLPWSTDAAVYRRALTYRMNQAGTIKLLNDDNATLNAANFAQVKTLLANGYVFTIATNIDNWRYVTIKHDPASTQNDSGYVGKPGCRATQLKRDKDGKPVESGHAMTLVGYNDDVWIDVNQNNVVDPGEKGAFRIANTWDTTWAPRNDDDTATAEEKAVTDGGLSWLSYDALLPVSSIPNAPTVEREAAFVVYGNIVQYLTARPTPYTPTLLGQFTLNAAKRNHLNVRVGTSVTTEAAPTATAPTGALTDQENNGVPLGKGGTFGFNGTAAAVNGDFAFDLTDVATNTATLQRYYLSLGDLAAGDPSQALSFVLTDAAGNQLTTPAQAVTTPATADNSTSLVYVDYVAPVAAGRPVINSAATATATAGTAFSYQITATNNPTSYGASSLPAGLSVAQATGLITGTPTTAGTYTISLSANNGAGTGSATLTLTVGGTAGVTAPIFSSPATASATVGTPFSYQTAAAPAVQFYNLTGTLPPGLTFTAATGVLSGTPTSPGTYTLTIGATNASGSTNLALVLTVAPRPATAGVPVFTSSTLVSVLAGDQLTYRSAATNNPTGFAATGLPDGLTINAANGLISGRVLGARAYTVVVSATNAAGTGYLTLFLNVVGNDTSSPINNNLANAINLRAANPATGSGGNATATAEPGEPTHGGQPALRSVWWQWTSPSTGTAMVDTTGSSFRTIVEVYSGETYETLQSVGSSNGDGALPAGIVTFQATTGTTYSVAVDGPVNDAGAIALRITAPTGTAEGRPANDQFSNRIVLAPNATVTVEGENINATAEAGEPVVEGQTTPANTVWYTYTPPDSGTLTIDTNNSDFDTILSVYTGSAVNALKLVGSNDQGSEDDNTSKLVIPVVQGTAYQIAVSGYDGEEGNVTLNLNLVPAVAVTLRVTATTQTVSSAAGLPGIITIERTAGELALPIVVTYQVVGSADDADFRPLKGFVKLKPGKTSKRIMIYPINRGSGVRGTVSVKLKIQPDANYTVEGKAKAKVVIVRDGTGAPQQ